MKVSEVNNVQSSEMISKEVSRTKRLEEVNKFNQAVEDKAEKKQKDPSEEELEDGVEQLNGAVHAFHEDLNFKLHEKSERMMVELVNVDKDEVIKEFPPKEMLDMLGRIKEMVGLIIDEKI